MLAGRTITSNAGGLRGGGSLSSKALQLIISRCTVGCEQSISVGCGNSGHKRVMTVAVGIADGMAAANGALNAMVPLTMMVIMIVIII